MWIIWNIKNYVNDKKNKVNTIVNAIPNIISEINSITEDENTVPEVAFGGSNLTENIEANKESPTKTWNINIDIEPTFNLPNTWDVAPEKPLNDEITEKVWKWGKEVMEDVWGWMQDEAWAAAYNNEQANMMREDINRLNKAMVFAYNPKNWRAYKLDVWNSNYAQERWTDAVDEFIYNYDHAQNYAEQEKARDDFYNKWKWLFVKTLAYTTSQNWSKIYDNYASRFSEDELQNLEKIDNDLAQFWKYEPTKEEFWGYIELLSENEDAYKEAAKRYSTAYDWRERLDMWSDEISQLRSSLYEKAELWLDETIYNKIASLDWDKAAQAIRYYRDVENDQFNRILMRVSMVFEYEKMALAKPISERNEWDLYIIEAADLIRKGLDRYAWNLNDWMNRLIDEAVDDKWQITDALDVFSDGTALNDVLTRGLASTMWMDVNSSWAFNSKHVSPIDIFNKAANDAIYNYKKTNTKWASKRLWDDYENAWEKIWDAFWEYWQGGSRFVHSVVSLITLNGWDTQTNDYLDMDMSIGKLIETDDSLARRDVKKFYLWVAEYAPEVIANVAPDVLSIAYFNEGWAAKTLSNIWRIWRFNKATKFNKWVKAAEAMEKLKKKFPVVAKWLRWLERVWEIWREWANIDSKNKRLWNIADRTLTQLAIWQTMDAKLSTFDSEPYSQTSFWISVLWSVIWDIAPEAKDLWWIRRTWAKWGKWMWWVWDVIDFMSQWKENKEAVARALWKSKNKLTFSEQDLKNYVDAFSEVASAAEKVYNNLTPEEKALANSWTKELMYNYVKQAYWKNSTAISAAIWQMVKDERLNASDILKYLGWIPWDVKIWPYTSIIQLKHGTLAWVRATNWGWYDKWLDVLEWWFDKRVREWFSNEDISRISSVSKYDDIGKNKEKFFNKVWDIYYLTDAWLERFGLESKSLTLESLWVTMEQAENTREILKERMKDLPNRDIEDDTIEMLANWGGYDELVNKVKEILC